MKIAMIVLGFPPQCLAGTEIATYFIAKSLSEKGHLIHVITSASTGIPNDSVEGGFQIHRIIWHNIRLLGFMIFAIEIVINLYKIKPDIVHSQDIKFGIPAFLFKKFFRTPFVVWAQGSDIYLPWLFKSFMARIVLRNADAVIALTEDMKSTIKSFCSREIDIIPNGIYLDNFYDLSKMSCRQKLNILPNESIILFVGRLNPIKGVKYLIHAMSTISIEIANAKLLIIGSDQDEQANLEELVKKLHLEEKIRFLGRISNDQVIVHMVASDIFVLPSLSEGFPLTILEAMASGLPIIASNVRGVGEIIRDGKNGFLVPPKSSEQIADRILLLLKDKSMYENISSNNKSEAKNYDWKKVISQLEQIYYKIYKSRSNHYNDR